MSKSPSSQLGLVAVTLAGFYLLYQAFSTSLSVVAHFAYALGEGGISNLGADLFLSLGPTISLLAFGLYLVFGRHSVAAGLFGTPSPETDTSPDVMLATVTGVGLAFLVLGLVCLAELTTEWIALNVREPLEAYPERYAIDVWPYRLRAAVELACGYLLTFRAPSIAAYLRSHAR